ncbi:SCP2 sterol-binding domain-containing protein [Streptomyces sp. AA1529]|uniref:SCP2 sterol-binding domain-containing protein n=1 Tax=Streptomyces sp. AA1529 TaxID=1203257 RepID=UPI0002E006A4|nr:SCP2 sterol-binding domain-containing protein [Streptomyces sp. AA1529]
MTGRETAPHRLRDPARTGGTVEVLPPEATEALLDLVFECFRARFGPRRAALASGVFHYEIDTPHGVRHRYVAVGGGSCTTTSAALDGPADATIGVTLADLVALAAGESKGTDAFVGGRLKISGDVFFAMSWIEWSGARSGSASGPDAEPA